MKKIALIMILAGTLGVLSCKRKSASPAGQTQVMSAADSAQLKEYTEFQQWKEMKAKEAAAPAPVVVREKTVVVERPVATTSTSTKKGWSKEAKGTVIGAGAGAVAGAVINKKNRGIGAVVGAVIGGGVGNRIGHSKDKKDGRN